ncbi:MAG: thiamine ABC transporter substrate-binding protein, partial [Pseudomonadota bacterium]
SQFKQKKIRFVSYPSFISSYGPGPEIAKRFKERTGYDVELINGGGPLLILQRFESDKNLRADVVLGVDRLLEKRAQSLGWKSLPSNFNERVKDELKVFEQSSYFVPVEWSPLTMIYRDKSEGGEGKTFPNVGAFLSEVKGQSWVIEDPRSSGVGQQWLYWFYTQDISEERLAETKPRIANSWTQAYGLFKRKSADWVFSYLTSAVFHWEKENDRSYKFVKFESGHPFQVNAAGVLDRCEECEMATKFVEFLLEPGTQAIIMQKNFMLPAVKGFEPSGLFAELPKVDLISYDKVPEFQSREQETQRRYLDALK